LKFIKALLLLVGHAIFTWIPSHLVSHGNTVVDQEAKRESQEILNLLSSEEAMNLKARIIALASALKIELADGSRR
jgi:hypothetical protein